MTPDTPSLYVVEIDGGIVEMRDPDMIEAVEALRYHEAQEGRFHVYRIDFTGSVPATVSDVTRETVKKAFDLYDDLPDWLVNLDHRAYEEAQGEAAVAMADERQKWADWRAVQ